MIKRILFLLASLIVNMQYCFAGDKYLSVQNDTLEYPICDILPPENSLIEKWEFHYDYYPVCIVSPSNTDALADYLTNIWYDSDNDEFIYETFEKYLNCVKYVDCVIDNTSIYFRGLSINNPEFWLKGEIIDNKEVVFENGQILGRYKEMGGYPEYPVIHESFFIPAFMYVEMEEPTGRTHFYDVFPESIQPALICEYDNASQILTQQTPKVDGLNGEGHYGFSIVDDRRPMYFGSLSYYFGDWPAEWNASKYYSTYINVSFKKSDNSSANSLIYNTENTDDSVYDLNGLRVNPEKMSSGIYIRNGRKFVVTK